MDKEPKQEPLGR